MAIIKRFSIGIQPLVRMFRVASLSGVLADSVLAARDSGRLGDDLYYESVGVSLPLTMRNDKLGHVLAVSADNVVVTWDYFKSGKSFDFNKVLTEFRAVWSAVNAVLKMRDLRRVGIVTEHRFVPESGHPSKELMSTLTKLDRWDPEGYKDRFRLRWESRAIAQDGTIPNREKADFINQIAEIYDSAVDTDNPQDGAFNVNLDIQRYYAPAVNNDVVDEVLKLYNKTYVSASDKLLRALDNLGVTRGPSV